MRRAGSSWVLVWALVIPGVASAQQEPRPPSVLPSPTFSLDARMKFLATRLEAGSGPARLWWYGWTIGYTAAAIGYGAAALSVGNREIRQDAWVACASTVFGAAATFFDPFPAALSPAQIRQAATDSELPQLEQWMHEGAQAEKLGRSPLAHGLGVGVAILEGLVIALGFHRPADAAITAGISVVFAELQIWTQPTAAIGDVAAYESLR